MSILTPDTQSLGFPRRSVRHIMGHVMLALLPGTVVLAVLIDAAIIFNVLAAVVVAVCGEAALLRLRARAVKPALGDGSIALAAWLLALSVPPSLPLWQLIVGVLVMTTLGKHLYGGLGQNPFNPAMVAYAVLIVSFPVTMTAWPSVNEGIVVASSPAAAPVTQTQTQTQTQIQIQIQRQTRNWDAMTGATPLDRLREIRLTAANTPRSASDTAVSVADYRGHAGGLILQSPWTWVSIAWLCGGLYLLWLRVISWHIPVSVLGALAALYAGHALIDSAMVLPVVPALLSGAIMLGAFFIATDPVTAAASNRGKLIYGAGIGLFTFIIREFSSYPEGFAFAVLLMNTCVPLIDYVVTGPRGKAGASGT